LLTPLHTRKYGEKVPEGRLNIFTKPDLRKKDVNELMGKKIMSIIKSIDTDIPGSPVKKDRKELQINRQTTNLPREPETATFS